MPNAYEFGKSGVMGWVASPQKDISTSQPWSLWTRPLWINRVIEMGSHPMNGILIRGVKHHVTTDTEREQFVATEKETGEPQLWAKVQGWTATTGSGRDQAGSFPGAFTGSVALPRPGFGTSRLQESGRKHFYCFKPSSLRILVWTVYIHYLKIGRQSPKEL